MNDEKLDLNQATWEMTDIYKEDRYETPKWVFKMILNNILNKFEKRRVSVLDVGTAEAALPNFLLKNLNCDVSGLEFSEDLVSLAREKVPACDTRQGDANDLSCYEDESFDVVTCVGVISIFDDFRPSVNEMIRVTKPGGLLMVQNFWNAFPVDLIIRTRFATQDPDQEFEGWTAGWNMISLKTMSAFLDQSSRVDSYYFEKVILPYDIQPNNENPLRSWTSIGQDGDRFHMNGIGRLLDKRLLNVEMTI